jgi:hypothetical protein
VTVLASEANTDASRMPGNSTLLDDRYNFDTSLIGAGPDFCYVLTCSAGRYGSRWVLDGTKANYVTAADPIDGHRLDNAGSFTITCSAELVLLLLVTGKLSRDSLKLTRAFENRLEIPFGLPKIQSPVILQISRNTLAQPVRPVVLPWDATKLPDVQTPAAA